ncbi:MAG: SDR family NAD(P)-dependent oxidoreductase [Caldilineaceae bacterium SB0675_bin_29]|uniref:SDR family NAD(P)-dependent oxidoreductase n=1 Tax=Caldilineaceae bacterium SB0675_bin_29 TaxID=2605266 RepID=A0A6B1G230_9CHLR|nr:SDR family NAD(P)-dependent oxidoreductase [Caldilineaceae bacterium SB0675_bin_29]
MTQKWTSADIPDQTGRTVLVTGGNSGLGFHTCRLLAEKGARVLLASRSSQRGDQARTEILQAFPDAQLEVISLDLADLESVRHCAASLRTDLDSLHILVNNAGVMAIPRQETAQGFERQFGVNHLGHFALTGALLPLLLKTPASRIVNVSSMAHRNGRMNFSDLHGQRKYSPFGAYSQSKLANLLFTLELQRGLESNCDGTMCVSAHPGFSATNLQYVAAKEKGSAVELILMRILNALLSQSAEQGALPQLYAATAHDVSGGDYTGPDGWMQMRGSPVKHRAKETAYDTVAAQELWRLSVELTGEPFEQLQD